MITPCPRPFVPVPSARPLAVFGIISLMIVVLLSLVRPVAMPVATTLPAAAVPALPYARTDSNVFIENRGQFAPELVAVMLAHEAQLGVGRDGRLHLKINNAPSLTLKFTSEGATPEPQVVLTSPLATNVSFLIGANPEHWHANVPVWKEVQLRGVIPQLTLTLAVDEGRLRIRASPEGRPDLERVRLIIDGATVVGVGVDGIAVQAGAQHLTLPLLEMTGSYDGLHHIRPTIIEAHVVGAPLAPSGLVGPHQPLASTSAAHLLAASTFLGSPGGGSGHDEATALAFDAQGNVLVAGKTGSVNFPTTAGAYDTTYNSEDRNEEHDAFVAKMDSNLTTLLAATFLGGRLSDAATALALDAQGNVLVAGWTQSVDFPTTPGAYDPTHNGLGDAFVAKLSSDLTTLLAATLLGGMFWDAATALAFDAQGNVLLAGRTESADFPATPGAYDPTYNDGGEPDAFVAKLSSDLTTLLAATFLGGGQRDAATALALDGRGNLLLAGWTESHNFPTTPGAYDPTRNGWRDAFVAKMDSNLTTLLAATFLGGSSGSDQATALALDAQGNVLLAGETGSVNFPTTAGAYDTTYNGDERDAFVAKMDSNLTTLLAATFLGGRNVDAATALALDAQGNVLLAGRTASANFPTAAGAYDPTFNGRDDAFVAKLSSNLTTLLAATFLGGSSSSDTAAALALDAQGNVLVAGGTDSAAFPTTAGAYDPTFNGGHDAFVAKLSSNLTTLLVATLLGGSSGLDTATELAFDAQGNVLLAGWTESAAFPATAGAYDPTLDSERDVFVAKLSSDLTTLLAATFLGGSRGDEATALAFDAQGNVLVAGQTGSVNFPATAGAYDPTHNGLNDAFVAKLSSDLTTLLAATFLGGRVLDEATALALDAQGNVLLAGWTGSANFPTTPGAYDRTHDDMWDDAFVAKLSSDLTTLLAATFLGGSWWDTAIALALDAQGNVLVVGWTSSANFPAIPGAYDPTYNGGTDTFVAKLNSNLTALLAATFLGGGGSLGRDVATALALDAQGNVLVAGWTDSANFPATLGAYDTTLGDERDAFVAKLSSNLTTLLAATFLGGRGFDEATALALDAQGNVLLAGWTGSAYFPATPGAYDTTFNGWHDAFVAKLSSDLTTLLTATFLGGMQRDVATALALDAQGNVLLAGWTESVDFPATPGAYDATYNGGRNLFGGGDAFVAKLVKVRSKVYLPLTLR